MTPVAAAPRDVLIGLVGYCQFVPSYPLGPELKARLRRVAWPQSDNVSISEMNWSPIAIVQEFQASAMGFDRIVLVALADRQLPPGSVTCRRWKGGQLAAQAVQERIFEAVTGVVNLDNLLVIGEHFGIWPQEVVTIEAQGPEAGLGDFILSEVAAGQKGATAGVVGQGPPSPEAERLMDGIAAAVCRAALGKTLQGPEFPALTAQDLKPPSDLCHTRFKQRRQPSAPFHDSQAM